MPHGDSMEGRGLKTTAYVMKNEGQKLITCRNVKVVDDLKRDLHEVKSIFGLLMRCKG